MTAADEPRIRLPAWFDSVWHGLVSEIFGNGGNGCSRRTGTKPGSASGLAGLCLVCRVEIMCSVGQMIGLFASSSVRPVPKRAYRPPAGNSVLNPPWQAVARRERAVNVGHRRTWLAVISVDAEISAKKNPPTEGGLNPILGGVGGDRSSMLHCAIFRQSSFVMRCITTANDTRGRHGRVRVLRGQVACSNVGQAIAQKMAGEFVRS